VPEAPVVDGLEIEHVSVDFGTVDLRIVPLYTVRGFSAAAFVEQFQQFFIAADIMLLNVILNALIILNPENSIPGLIISPTVVGCISQAGLVGAVAIGGCV
jgi:hypothetical protein